MGGTAKKIAAGDALVFKHTTRSPDVSDESGVRRRGRKSNVVSPPFVQGSNNSSPKTGGNDGSGGGKLTNREAAIKDLTDLFTRKAAGHLIQYMYLTPKALESWTAFMEHPEYSYVTRENRLITQVAKKDVYPEFQYDRGVIVGIENGPGTDSAMIAKSAPFWSNAGNVAYLYARDQSPTVVLNAPKVLERRLPNTTVIPDKCDFLKDPLRGRVPEGRRLMAEFGITRGNMQGFADDHFPVKLFKRDIATHFKLLNPGDLYTFTFDANQVDVDKVYDSPHLTEWGREMFRVMQEELPIEGDFDPDAFEFVPRWHGAPHHVNTNNMVATRSMEFNIAGQDIKVEKGDEFAITNSYKMPLDMFMGLADELKDEKGIELLTSPRQDRKTNGRMTMPVLIQR